MSSTDENIRRTRSSLRIRTVPTSSSSTSSTISSSTSSTSSSSSSSLVITPLITPMAIEPLITTDVKPVIGNIEPNKKLKQKSSAVINLAKKPNILQSINGMKIYRLVAQMDDLIDAECEISAKLSKMLHRKIKSYGKSSDADLIDRVNELIKKNIQKSKAVSQGIIKAEGELLNILEHKSCVTDIVRCTAQSNLKIIKKSSRN